MAMDFSIFKFGSASSAAEPTPVLKRAAGAGRDFGSMLSTERASANRDDSNRPGAAKKSRSESVLSDRRPERPARPESAPGNDAPSNEAATVGRGDVVAREARERAALRAEARPDLPAQAGQAGLTENSGRAEHAADNKTETDTGIENGRSEETHKLIDDEYGLFGADAAPFSSVIGAAGVAEEVAALKTEKSEYGYGVEVLREALLSNSASGIEESGALLGSLLNSSNSTMIGSTIGGTADAAIGIGSVVAEAVSADGAVLADEEVLTDGGGKANRASILLGNDHGDGATEVPWASTHSDIGTDTRLFALSDHFEGLPGAFETSETGEGNEASFGLGTGTEPGKSQAFSLLEAEELAFRIDLGAHGVDGIGSAKLPGGSSATVEDGSEAVAATGSVATETAVFMTDGDDVAATLTTVLPDNLPENLIDASGDDPVASTTGLGAQFSHSSQTVEAGKQHAPALGAVAKASASLSRETGAGEIAEATSESVANETASSEAEAGEADTAASGAENGKNKGTEQSRAGSSLKGLENAVERLRENRTAADANGIKRLIEQAEAGAEVDGNGNEANAKSAEGQQNGLKGEGNGTGTGFGKGSAGLFYGSSYGGGSGSDGQPGKGNGSPATAQDYAALIGRDGALRSMSFTETVRAATTGASAAEGVENTIKVYEKFAQAIKLSFLGGGKQVNLRLSPAHLGNLQIKLTSDGSSVTAKIIVDSVAVKNLFESDAGKLKELFNQQGLNMEEYTVEVRERSIGANDSGGADLWERYADKGASSKERDREVVVPVEGAVIKASMNAAYGLGANRGIDLFA